MAMNEQIREMGETDLSKLSEYEQIPRKRDTAFFQEIAGKAPLFGKRKFYEPFENAKIVYPVVVQASYKLFSPGNINKAAVIVVLPITEKYIKDFASLHKIENILIAMRNNEMETPQSLAELVEDLNNPKSFIDCKIKGEDLGLENLQGAEFLVTTIYVSQLNLPDRMIPNNEVLPCLEFKDDKGPFYIPIHGKWYVKG